MHNLTDGKKFKRIAGEPSWTTPTILGVYESNDGNKQARLMFGMIGEDLPIWGVEIADITKKELIDAKGYDNADEALKFIKSKLK